MNLKEYLTVNNLTAAKFRRQVLSIAPANFKLSMSAIIMYLHNQRWPSAYTAYWLSKATGFSVRPWDLMFTSERLLEFEQGNVAPTPKKPLTPPPN